MSGEKECCESEAITMGKEPEVAKVETISFKLKVGDKIVEVTREDFENLNMGECYALRRFDRDEDLLKVALFKVLN